MLFDLSRLIRRLLKYLYSTSTTTHPNPQSLEPKQNQESIEVCSKCMIQKKITINSDKGLVSTSINICKPLMGRNQVSGGVSVPCRRATSVADALWKPILSNKAKIGSNSSLWRYHELVMHNWECQGSQQLENMQVPKKTGLGVLRSKRPLSACHTRRKF